MNPSRSARRTTIHPCALASLIAVIRDRVERPLQGR
eukprot:IDg14379t1